MNIGKHELRYLKGTLDYVLVCERFGVALQTGVRMRLTVSLILFLHLF